jgi:hypothetical protein
MIAKKNRIKTDIIGDQLINARKHNINAYLTHASHVKDVMITSLSRPSIPVGTVYEPPILPTAFALHAGWRPV